MVIIAPTWLVLGVLFCWVPAMIGVRKGDPAWGWALFGVVALPIAILFAVAEKPLAERHA